MDRPEIIAMGEPGCYIAEGHLDLVGVWQMVQDVVTYYEGSVLDLDPPRHTWMVAREPGEVDDDYPDWEIYYREVAPGTEGAVPYTLIPVEGYWSPAPGVE
jgi:hypothetical protein